MWTSSYPIEAEFITDFIHAVISHQLMTKAEVMDLFLHWVFV